MIRSLPSNAQICLLLNKEGESDHLTDIRMEQEQHRTTVSRLWTYAPGTFSFARARNLCDEMATSDWIFWIDCDEMLSPAQHAGIYDSITRVGGGVAGFMAGQASLSLYEKLIGKTDRGTYINIAQCRLYRNHHGFKWEGHAHEQIITSIRRGGYSIIETTLTVIHNGYSGSPESLKGKLRRNTSLIGRWLREHDESHELFSFYSDIWSRDFQALTTLENT